MEIKMAVYKLNKNKRQEKSLVNFFKRPSKKAQSQMFWILMVAIIAIIAATFIILWFRNSGGAAFGSLDTTIDKFGDCDNDDIANYFDDCPCEVGVAEFDGCADANKVDECTEDQIKKCAE